MNNDQPQRGQLITLEGGEGVGKSTNVSFVVEYLEKKGIEVVRTREPGGSPRAEKIRQLLLDPSESEPLDDMAELLLVFAARAQHIAMTIEPALARGAFVVCDRFVDASYAYQGTARGMDIHTIQQLESMVLQKLAPDLTILLDMPEEEARKRVVSRGQALDRFEKLPEDFFQQVRKGYLLCVKRHPERFAVIDASRPLVDVQRDIAHAIDQRYV